MAKLIFSPLIAGISGKAADAVFASWKGRAYVRQRVVPANPQSVLQTAQRNAMSECVAMWHALSAVLLAAYGYGAAALNISGYNDFTGRNVVAVKDETGLFGPRRNTDAALPRIDVPIDMGIAGQAAGGIQRITWTDPGQGADYHFGYLDYNLTDNVIHKQEISATPTATETFSITGHSVGDHYALGCWVHRASDGEMVHALTGHWTQTV